MSCSDEYVSHDKQNNLINITPSLQAKLRKANMVYITILRWNCVTGPKDPLIMKVIATNTSSMVYRLIDVWK